MPEPGENPFFLAFGWFQAYSYERNWARALEIAESIDTSSPITRMSRAYCSGVAQKELGDAATSQASLDEAASICRDILAASPGNSLIRGLLGSIYSELGRGAEAIQEMKLAVDLTSRDLYEGPESLENLAFAYGKARRTDEALDLIDRLLSMNYANPLPVHDLKLNPRWDPLRVEPRFKEILAKHEKAL